MRKKHQSSVIFRVALILLCLVLFSAHLSSGMLAKYTSQGVVEQSTRVAATSITFSSPAEPVIGNDGIGSMNIIVTNESEVALEYSVVIQPVCAALTVAQLADAFVNPQLDGVDGVYDSSTGAFTFATATQFVPGEQVNMTLTFQTNDVVYVTDGTQNVDYEDISLNIYAKATQLD